MVGHGVPTVNQKTRFRRSTSASISAMMRVAFAVSRSIGDSKRYTARLSLGDGDPGEPRAGGPKDNRPGAMTEAFPKALAFWGASNHAPSRSKSD